MTKKRTQQKSFSVTKAVKANARERVGQPKPARIIEPLPEKSRRQKKFRQTLGQTLDRVLEEE